MQATEILMQEHRVIEGLLSAVETAAQAAARGEAVRPAFFIEAADFISGFADGCHHHKEEGVLFKAMADNGVPVLGGPVGMMLQEHEMGRQFTRGMRAAAEEWQQGSEPARSRVVENALGYAALLRQHILKEDRILFPMADRFIPEADHASVMTGFERVEHAETGPGVHEKYLALAGRLEKEMAA